MQGFGGNFLARSGYVQAQCHIGGSVPCPPTLNHAAMASMTRHRRLASLEEVIYPTCMQAKKKAQQLELKVRLGVQMRKAEGGVLD